MSKQSFLSSLPVRAHSHVANMSVNGTTASSSTDEGDESAPSILGADTLMCFEGLVSLMLQLGQVRWMTQR